MQVASQLREAQQKWLNRLRAPPASWPTGLPGDGAIHPGQDEYAGDLVIATAIGTAAKVAGGGGGPMQDPGVCPGPERVPGEDGGPRGDGEAVEDRVSGSEEKN